MKTQNLVNAELLKQKIERLPYYVIRFIESNSHMAPSSLLAYSSDIEDFFNWLIAEGISKSKTVKDIEVLTLNDLDRDEIDMFILQLKNQKNGRGIPLSSATINRKISALKSLFRFLNVTDVPKVRRPYIERNVMSQIQLQKNSSSEDIRIDNIQNNILIEEEIQIFREFVAEGFGIKEEVSKSKRLFNNWKDNKERDTAIISLLLGTGLRIGELVDVTLDDIDKVGRKMKVLRKGNDFRYISYSKRAEQDLLNYLEIRETRYKAKGVDALFVSTYGGQCKPLTKRAMQKLIEKYALYFGKPDVTAHKLRHSFATNHMKKVNSIPILQKILNHASPNTTMIYAKIFDSEVQESIDKADE
ncbi:tyrosine recombinase XerS [Bacillus salitolerans]|uniref:Tyrosine recombinase XerS n=1 Tax=Bacillus salitolerans TaxID=1437434 RepID=A0ABW4LNI9_9BACI